jgi:hypothetical protein
MYDPCLTCPYVKTTCRKTCKLKMRVLRESSKAKVVTLHDRAGHVVRDFSKDADLDHDIYIDTEFESFRENVPKFPRSF